MTGEPPLISPYQPSMAFPYAMPSQVLQATPEVLFSLGGESDIGDSAEYGELSTKD